MTQTVPQRLVLALAIAVLVLTPGCGDAAPISLRPALSTSTSQPPPLYEPAMAYDPASQQLIMFGGGGFAVTSQTWVFTRTGWQLLHPPTSPPAREGASMTYDPELHALVMFGGISFTLGDESKALSDGGSNTNDRFLDTWTWDGTTWSEVASGIDGQTSPQSANSLDGVMETNLAYSASDHELVLDEICATECESNRSRTWQFLPSLHTWERLPTPAAMPWNQAGQSDNTPPGLTSEWPKCNPSQNFGPSRAVTASPDGSLLYVGQGAGGSPDRVSGTDRPVNHRLPETWTFSSNVWHALPTARLPNNANQLSFPAMAPDVENHMVLFAEYGQTWVWSGSAWTEPALATSPGTRCGEAIAYDPAIGVDVLFGGVARAGGGLVDTWTWNGASWSRAAGAADPIPLVNHQPQAPPSPASIPTTKAQVLAASFNGRDGRVVQAKLVRGRQLGSFGDYPLGQPDRLLWTVLAQCNGSCIHDGRAGTKPSWSWTTVDAYSLSSCDNPDGCVSFVLGGATSYPNAWNALPDLSV